MLAALGRQKVSGKPDTIWQPPAYGQRLNTEYCQRLAVRHRGRCFLPQDFLATLRVFNAFAWWGILTSKSLSTCSAIHGHRQWHKAIDYAFRDWVISIATAKYLHRKKWFSSMGYAYCHQMARVNLICLRSFSPTRKLSSNLLQSNQLRKPCLLVIENVWSRAILLPFWWKNLQTSRWSACIFSSKGEQPFLHSTRDSFNEQAKLR